MKLINAKILFLSLFFELVIFPLLAQNSYPVYKDAESPIEHRIEDILSLITLEEKADLLSGVDMWHFKGISRLGIPSVQVTDCGHGITIIIDNDGNWVGNATCFPTAAAQAATWNRSLIEELGGALGRETRATGSSFLLAPMVNIKRHPLNGRNYELFSEDPLLSGEMAASFINGVQSEEIGAVIKAMTANNQQTNQSVLDVQMDERTLQEIYLPSFRIAVSKSNPWGVMTAYNGLNGFRTSASKHLLMDVLKEDWNYEGFVVSDWRAVKSIQSLYSGLDIEMPGPGNYLTKENILNAIADKSFTADELDDKVKRILRALVKSRLIDYDQPKLSAELNSEKHKLLARKVGEEGIVLLKNENNLLPLKQNIKKLAVIGPNANQARLGGGGSASVSPFYSVSPMEGIRNLCGPDTEILFEEGCGLNGNMEVVDSKYLRAIKKGTVGNCLKGEYFTNSNLQGQPACTDMDGSVDFSWGWANPKPQIGKEGYSVRWEGQLVPPVSGEYKIGISAAGCGYRLFLKDDLIIDHWDPDNKDNFEAEFTSGSKKVSILLNKNSPVDIKIEFKKITNRNFIRFEWEIPGNNSIESAKKIARESDAVVIFAGLSNFFEGGNNDRPDILLPGEQNKLIKEVAGVNPNTIVFLINGSSIAMPWIDNVNAVVEAYYPGQEGGNAIANILFGKVNPSGKLPETFPLLLSDCPAYGNYPGEGNIVKYNEGIYVGYRHYDSRNIEPLFPFGHGLSYTTFEYGDLMLKNIKNSVICRFNVKNTGGVDGAEVVQLYLHDVISSESRPQKELKNFEKVFLKAGETKTVTFTITEEDLSYYSDTHNKWLYESGKFEVLIGSSSRDIRIRGEFFY
ncbi:MAG TPA: glycoside hydrolase family 3 C-terminal domain-containing protein [Bacteroidales bacterium]|nr:glycoside hydrolase family 3 C-terminal domain-containing protein [Bacteroidales bacterium]